ncbi:AAA family ATPase [Saccharopolyspora tripterygii]
MPRYVLTGAPGAGKTAILRQLEIEGHVVVEEAATDVIALAQARGVEKPWEDSRFIDEVITLQRRRESAVRAATAFFDRSPVCTLALSRYLGFSPTPLLTDAIERVVAAKTYSATVFFVRSQGFVEPTAARQISHEDSLAFEQLHEKTYRELGFRLVEVPAARLDERVALVRQNLV